jgi:hypothetical protein
MNDNCHATISNSPSARMQVLNSYIFAIFPQIIFIHCKQAGDMRRIGSTAIGASIFPHSDIPDIVNEMSILATANAMDFVFNILPIIIPAFYYHIGSMMIENVCTFEARDVTHVNNGAS